MIQSMRLMTLAVCAAMLLPALRAESDAHDHGHNHGPAFELPSAFDAGASLTQRLTLPPLPEGVAELKFSEFYKLPVGPRGLEPTERLRSLEGKRVRILGFMARQDDPTSGALLLVPRPVNLHEHEYGLADDLPPQTVHVRVPEMADAPVPFTPGPLLLTGRLELGNRREQDGRMSYVRLILDAPTSATLSATEERAVAEEHAH
jgi:hypothetical protein